MLNSLLLWRICNWRLFGEWHVMRLSISHCWWLFMACQFWLTHCCTQGTLQGCEWISTSLSSQASHNLLLGPHSTKRAVLFYCTPQMMPCMEILHLIACVCKGHLSGQQLKLCFQRLLPIGLVWGMITNQIPFEPYDPIDIMLVTLWSPWVCQGHFLFPSNSQQMTV